MRVLGIGDSVSVVRDNDFIDSFHAIGIYGPPVHFVGNRVRVENPLGVPTSKVPGSAILGGDGIGIVVNADRARIVDNHISDIRRRDPFPGINWDASLVTWERANGSGIWQAPAARENEVSGNVFVRIAGPAITVEGSANRVSLHAPGDTVADLGRENLVQSPPSALP